jgi:hypothetical protein
MRNSMQGRAREAVCLRLTNPPVNPNSLILIGLQIESILLLTMGCSNEKFHAGKGPRSGLPPTYKPSGIFAVTL